MEASEEMMASASDQANQALMEAVKRKFANKGKLMNTEGEPAFHIPPLQIPVLRAGAAKKPGAKMPLPLNNNNGIMFKLLHENAKKQLQQQQQHLTQTNDFIEPMLKAPAMAFSLPQLSMNLRNLKLNESIDLASALYKEGTITGPKKPKVNESPKVYYDQYCVSAGADIEFDISTYTSNPSGAALVFKLKIKRGKSALPSIYGVPKEPLHKIEAFAFDTPSPDDKAKLEKMRR